MIGAASESSLMLKVKKDMFSNKSGTLRKSPSKESINSLASVGSDTSFFGGVQSKYAEVSCIENISMAFIRDIN